jgi:hypothetical protein
VPLLVQVIPLFIMVQGAHPNFWTPLLRCCGLNTGSAADEALVQQQQGGASADPLRVFLAQKMRSHRGFVLQAFVQGTPQAFLQMIAIVKVGIIPTLTYYSVSASRFASHALIIAASAAADLHVHPDGRDARPANLVLNPPADVPLQHVLLLR